MKKKIYISVALGWLVVGLVLFAFQNCSEPESSSASSDSTSSGGSAGVPGAANNSNDLNNTGISNQVTTNVGVAVGSKPSSLYVSILYQGVLQRSPTSQELGSWAQYIGLGYGCTFIAQQVLGSAEYVTLVKTQSAATAGYGIVKGLLNRAPTVAEQSAALAAYNASGGSTSVLAPQLAAAILGGQEFKTYCSQYEKMKL